jgi:hypothetical protein
VENENMIIVGNLFGDIEVHTVSNLETSRIIDTIHNAEIIFIEQYEFARAEEYVIVDVSGHVTIWNNNLSSLKASFDFNSTVISVALREQENRSL